MAERYRVVLSGPQSATIDPSVGTSETSYETPHTSSYRMTPIAPSPEC
jgi:hypothetical protein